MCASLRFHESQEEARTLADIIQISSKHPTEAIFHLYNGDFQRFLDSMGEDECAIYTKLVVEVHNWTESFGLELFLLFASTTDILVRHSLMSKLGREVYWFDYVLETDVGVRYAMAYYLAKKVPRRLLESFAEEVQETYGDSIPNGTILEIKRGFLRKPLHISGQNMDIVRRVLRSPVYQKRLWGLGL